MPIAAWSSPEWLNEVTSWIQQQAAANQFTSVSAPEHVRTSMTANVFRVPTAQGNLYFKATTPPFTFEAPLTSTLADLFPRELPHIYSFDAGRGWLLMADVGETLRPKVQATGDFSSWTAMLQQWAAFQQASTALIPDMLKIGVPDRRLEKLPGLYADVLKDEATLMVGKPEGFTPDEMKRLHDFTPQVAQMCEKLASYGIPAALHHDDFHDNNIAYGSGGKFIFFDWGECAVTHPFFSMMVLGRVVRLLHERLDVADELRDTYLNAWLQYGTLDTLRNEVFPLALRLAVLCRALTWHYVLSTHDLSDEERADSGDAAAYYLRLFYEYETSDEK